MNLGLTYMGVLVTLLLCINHGFLVGSLALDRSCKFMPHTCFTEERHALLPKETKATTVLTLFLPHF